MDIPQLVSVLQGALSQEENQRKAAEALLQQVRPAVGGGDGRRRGRLRCARAHPGVVLPPPAPAPGSQAVGARPCCRRATYRRCRCPPPAATQHEGDRGQVVALLRIAAEPSVDMGVRHIAAITFKNAVKRRWDPEQDGAPMSAALACSSMPAWGARAGSQHCAPLSDPQPLVCCGRPLRPPRSGGQGGGSGQHARGTAAVSAARSGRNRGLGQPTIPVNGQQVSTETVGSSAHLIMPTLRNGEDTPVVGAAARTPEPTPADQAHLLCYCATKPFLQLPPHDPVPDG
jgi:hypothetical protein